MIRSLRRPDVKLLVVSFAFFMLVLTVRLAYAQPVEDQYVQIVSYAGPRVQFVAKPYRTSVMTFNCTVECFSARDFNTAVVILENRTIVAENFTGFYWSHDLVLPKKRLVKLTVVLNGIEYWFELLIVKRPPTPEEIEKIETILLSKEEYQMSQWRAWGGAIVGGIAMAVPVAFLIARRLRVGRVEEL